MSLALLAEVDRMGAKVTFLHLAEGGWKCVLSGVEMPPHFGVGRTGYEALEETLRLARRIGSAL